MNWHYEHAGQALGPVSEEEIQVLRSRGIITGQHRVWRQDWPGWRHAGEVWPVVPMTAFDPNQSAPPPQAAQYLAGATCEECGGKDVQMDSIGGLPVCRNCAPFARVKASHGMPLGIGPWRDGRQFIMRKEVPLPPLCVKCAQPAEEGLKKRLSWHPSWIYLTLLPLLLPYAFVAMSVRQTLTVSLPLCPSCRRKRVRNIAVSVSSLFLSLALLITGYFLFRRSQPLAKPFFIGAAVVFLFFAFWVMLIQIAVARKMDERYAWITKVGPAWLSLLPRWPYG